MLFWFFWVVDLLIWLVCLYETFMVSSNSSMGTPALILTVCLAASLYFRESRSLLALWIAGLPAGLVLLFVAGWLLMLIFGNGRFQ